MDAGTIILTLLFFVGLACAVVAGFAWSQSKSMSIIDQWAAENGLTVVSAEQRYLFQGPFFFRSDESQRVYHVTIRDYAG